MEKPWMSVSSFCQRDVICPSHCGSADNSLAMEKNGKIVIATATQALESQDRQDSRSPIQL